MVRDQDEWTAQRLVATQVLADVMQKALIRCHGGESAIFEVEACDAMGCLALPANLVHGSGLDEFRQRRAPD
jgi:hypothetical protein